MNHSKLYQDFNGSILDDINSYAAGSVSIVSNSLLIFATSQVKTYTRSVRFSMYYMAFWRLVFSITVALANPAIEYSPTTRSLYIIKSGFTLPVPIGQALLVLFIVSIVMFCNSPCVQYLQVTVLLKAISKQDTNILIFLIPLFVGVPTVILIYFGYVPRFFDVYISPEIAQQINEQGEASFLIVTTHLADPSSNRHLYGFDVMSQICTLVILIVMTTSIIFAIFCYVRIKILMKKKFASSSASRKTQEYLNMMLLIQLILPLMCIFQFIFPFFTIHIPFYITFILPFFNSQFEFLSDNMLYLSAWCPAANPIIVICVVKFEMENDRATDIVRRASAVLKKAVDYDNLQKVNDAIPKYTEGITLLSMALRLMNKDHRKYEDVVKSLPEYQKRVDELKEKCHIEVIWTSRKIEDDSVGHGYDKIFEPCCNEKLRNVEVYDSYIRKNEQVVNFIRFCELVVLLSKQLKTITLKTHLEAKKNEAVFEKLGESLEKRGISLHFEFSDTIHDRQINFDNGWVVKIGRGLDYFKPTDPTEIGAYEMNLRKCKETTIDIMRPKK